MSAEKKPITLGRIFVFWAPLAATWLMMAVEGPFLAAVIARLAEPKYNLAAFGVAFAVAILVEAPVIQILSAATALVVGPRSFLRLRNFTYALNASITAVMLLLLVPPVWDGFALGLIGLPPEVSRLTHVSLLILLPWPAAIGYRRFFQGLMIRSNLTRRVAYGTVVRLTTMATVSVVLFGSTTLPGAWVGAAALSGAVCVESLATRLMARGAVRALLAADRPDRAEAPIDYGRILRFYYPLALTSVISLAVHPTVTFFMGHARHSLESLAVLPVVNSLSFVFRSLGLSYQEVAITMLARDEGTYPKVSRFAGALAVLSSVALAGIAFTPLATFWFGDVSGLTAELTAFSVTPLRILALLPALSVLLSLQRALLVHGRATGAITGAAVVEVVGIVGVLTWAIWGLGLVGATGAAVAFIAGRVGGNLYLVPPCRRVVRTMVGAERGAAARSGPVR